MLLTREEQEILDGAWGPAAKIALEMQVEVGCCLGAERMEPVTCVHLSADFEVMGDAGLRKLRELLSMGSRCAVPTTSNATCVDFAAAERLFQDPLMVKHEEEIRRLLRELGVTTVDTCIIYQTVYQPHFGEHVAWGDTGTVIYANSVLGARSNFESGPAALSAALTGRTPAYGFHLSENRRGTHLVDITATLEDLADWGALGAAIGQKITDYWAVPVLTGLPPTAASDNLKHLGASLASYGSLAMCHIVGVTPEARTVEEAFSRRVPAERLVITDADLAEVYRAYAPDRDEVELFVLTGPQLSVFELRTVAELLAGRMVSDHTELIVTTNSSNYEAARRLGYVEAIESAGGMVLVGVCWYLMAPGEMRDKFGWKSVVTNSAKLAHIIGASKYHAILRRTRDCIEAAVRGRISE